MAPLLVYLYIGKRPKMLANHRHRLEKCMKKYKTYYHTVETTQMPNSNTN